MEVTSFVNRLFSSGQIWALRSSIDRPEAGNNNHNIYVGTSMSKFQMKNRKLG